jgi:hypothetical protein
VRPNPECSRRIQKENSDPAVEYEKVITRCDFSLSSDLFLNRKPNHRPPAGQVRKHAHRHGETAEDLQTQEAAPLRADDGARDGAARQRAEGLHGERGSRPDADLPDVGHLGDQRRREADEASRREAEEHGVGDNGARGLAGYPQGEGDDGREGGYGYHHVEAAPLVAYEARCDSTDDAGADG